MTYPYQPNRIQEILDSPKCLPEGDSGDWKKMGKGSSGSIFETRPQLIDGPFVDMRYVAKAPMPQSVTTYDANFLLANHRVRGIGHNEVGRHNFRFKRKIPKGWHLNICDPNLPTNDPKQNIHKPLPGFSPTDFHDFISKTAKLWKLDLGWSWKGDLFS